MSRAEQTANTVHISSAFAIPSHFDVFVTFPENRSVSYRVKPNAEAHVIEISVNYDDGSFTENEYEQGAKFIHESLMDGSLHLPMTIDIQDVENSEQMEGVLDYIDVPLEG